MINPFEQPSEAEENDNGSINSQPDKIKIREAVPLEEEFRQQFYSPETIEVNEKEKLTVFDLRSSPENKKSDTPVFF